MTGIPQPTMSSTIAVPEPRPKSSANTGAPILTPMPPADGNQAVREDPFVLRALEKAGWNQPTAWFSRSGLIRRPGVSLIRTDYQLVKRIFDVSVCIVVLPVALAVMGACALLVWLDDPGPVLFCQLRTGKAGRRFKMLKFRTMVKNAAELKQKYSHLNELKWPDFKITNDPRMTRVGRILRKSSLDELPQLFNVLKGDMSLVGPRPTSFDASTYELWQTERLEVVPGITGLWQVSGRSDVDFDERLRMDIEYINNRSFWLDLYLLFRTITAVFSQRGAY